MALLGLAAFALASAGCGGAVGPPSTPPLACADGVDNDADGKTDFPADPGCSAASDDDESNGTVDGFPTSPSQVGPTNLGLLTASGDIVVTVDGTVLENVDVDGQIIVRASNVTIRNFRIRSTAYWGIAVESGTNILIEDGEIDGNDRVDDAVRGSNYTARRLYIHDIEGDAFKADGNNVIERCFVTAIGQGAGAHGDGVQMMGEGNIQILRNNFLLTTGSLTACIFPGGGGFIPGVNVVGNRLEGGGWVIYCNSEMQVIDNVFAPDPGYGIVTEECKTWSGNVWADTGEPADP